MPPMQLTLAPRIAFIYPTFPINPFIREEILSRNPNYSDTEPGYLF